MFAGGGVARAEAFVAGAVGVFLCPHFYYPRPLRENVAEGPDLEAELGGEVGEEREFSFLVLLCRLCFSDSACRALLHLINDRCHLGDVDLHT